MRIVFSTLGAAAVAALLAAPTLAAQMVPFVGCASDGQLGPVAAPRGEAKALDLAPALAAKLAWYQATSNAGALAPRGWKCFTIYGSSGASLAIAPGGVLDGSQPIDGPAVTLSQFSGGASGRFTVAKIAARLFAKEEASFIAGVVAEGLEPKADFPFGPYPADTLTPKNARLVEFATPGGKDGLGASDRLRKGPLPIVGLAKLVGDAGGPDALLLSVRLPAGEADLAAAIVQAAERTLPDAPP